MEDCTVFIHYCTLQKKTIAIEEEPRAKLASVTAFVVEKGCIGRWKYRISQPVKYTRMDN